MKKKIDMMEKHQDGLITIRANTLKSRYAEYKDIRNGINNILKYGLGYVINKNGNQTISEASELYFHEYLEDIDEVAWVASSLTNRHYYDKDKICRIVKEYSLRTDITSGDDHMFLDDVIYIKIIKTNTNDLVVGQKYFVKNKDVTTCDICVDISDDIAMFVSSCLQNENGRDIPVYKLSKNNDKVVCTVSTHKYNPHVSK
jgi:hypothetical protein